MRNACQNNSLPTTARDTAWTKQWPSPSTCRGTNASLEEVKKIFLNYFDSWGNWQILKQGIQVCNNFSKEICTTLTYCYCKTAGEIMFQRDSQHYPIHLCHSLVILYDQNQCWNCNHRANCSQMWHCKKTTTAQRKKKISKNTIRLYIGLQIKWWLSDYQFFSSWMVLALPILSIPYVVKSGARSLQWYVDMPRIFI